MRSFYRFTLWDLWLLVVCWLPVGVGLYQLMRNQGDAWILLVVIASLCMLVGWWVGLGVANALMYEKFWQRASVIVLNWLYVPMILGALGSGGIIFLDITVSSKPVLNYEKLLPAGILFLFCLGVIACTVRLYRRADRVITESNMKQVVAERIEKIKQERNEKS